MSKFAEGIGPLQRDQEGKRGPEQEGVRGDGRRREGQDALVSFSSGPGILGKRYTSEVQVCLFLAKCNRLFLREKSLKGL